jgi:hypothetical protein
MEKELVGKRIRMIAMMDDPNPIKEDELGTITHVGGGVINVSWDNGRKIGVVIGVDFYQILN